MAIGTLFVIPTGYPVVPVNFDLHGDRDREIERVREKEREREIERERERERER
jgi:hypothetical protein